jgi:hypothetical protein
MLSASEMDVQRESVRFLANASANPELRSQLLAYRGVLLEPDNDVANTDFLPLQGQAAVQATGSPDSHGAKTHVYHSWMDLLGSLLWLSKDKEVIRCAVTVIANLAQQPSLSVHPHLCQLLPRLLAIFDLVPCSDKITTLMFRETRRQIARALLAVVSNHDFQTPSRCAMDIAVHRQLYASLTKARHCEDGALRMLVEDALARLH